MNVTAPISKPFGLTSQKRRPSSVPQQETEPSVVDYVSRGVGILGGAIQVVLKTSRNAIAGFSLPPRLAGQDDKVEIPRLAKDPALVRTWSAASSLGGALFMGAVAGLCVGGPLAVAIGAGVGAKLFGFVDDKLADRARAEGKAPVFVDGALAKGRALAEGDSGLEVWSTAFSTMSRSSYVEVRDWYTSKVKERLSSESDVS